ncbi:MAG: hypothetical protein HDR24_12880 [Lachnospiraceae bacterium]|nr:hypothetical protein [Lachnospiraceae bacterium]
MNSVKIEKGAILTLRRIIYLHGKMNELLKEDDKGPSWDGDILIYSSEDLQVENIIYKVPTQVKGKNNENLLNRSRITYPVAYKNLRNYFNDGGVCYFVIVISDDGEKANIFYNALTPIKLQSLLKGTEKKKPDQTKSIPLNRLKNNNKDELFTILLQFGHDSKEQGAKELVRKSISLKDMKKIDSIRATAFTSVGASIIQEVAKGEACLFGHLKEADIWVPFDYDTQMQMEFVAWMKWNEPFKIDEKIYYDNFEIRKSDDETFLIKLSENLIINTGKSEFNFEALTDLDQVIKDIQFLEAFPYGKAFYVGKHKLCEYKYTHLNDHFLQKLNLFKQLQLAIIKFDLKLNKKFEDFADDDWKAVDDILNIYQGKIEPKENNAWHMWWWQGKVVPFFLAVDPNGELYIENGVCFKHLKISVGSEEERYIVPAFIMFKRDIWEKLYDVDEKILLEELDKGEFNKATEGNFTQLFIEILSAYDILKNEKYYNVAKSISDRLMEVDPNADYLRINKLQLKKRKRNLTENELQELENIEINTDDIKVICAVNILLENKRKAKKKLEEMSDGDREMFMTYPIYNLL